MSEITKKSDHRKVAEAEVESFRKDPGPFVVAAETTRMAMVFTDATDNPIIFAKRQLSLLNRVRPRRGARQEFQFSDGAKARC
jgi:hypothetical protein